MPTPPVTSAFFEIAQKGLMASAGGAAINTVFLWHFRRTAGTTTPNKANLSAAFQTAIGAAVVAALNARWSATVNSVRNVADALDAPVDFSITATGAITGDSMSSLDAAYIRLRTAVRGRSYRGSKHFGPMSESDTTTTSDVWNSGCLGRLATIATACITPFTDSDGNTWALSILSTSLSTLRTNPTSIIANDVTQAAANHVIGSMRRRKAGSVY